jgi:hypothetical protein
MWYLGYAMEMFALFLFCVESKVVARLNWRDASQAISSFLRQSWIEKVCIGVFEDMKHHTKDTKREIGAK